jgi:hypothetical protein
VVIPIIPEILPVPEIKDAMGRAVVRVSHHAKIRGFSMRGMEPIAVPQELLLKTVKRAAVQTATVCKIIPSVTL